MPNYQETLVLIDELTALPNGWRYGEGVGLGKMYANLFKSLVRSFYKLGLRRFNVFIGDDDGGILRTYHHEYIFELSASSDGNDISLETKDTILDHKENATPDEVIAFLDQFIQLCHLSEPSINETTTTKQENLPLPSLDVGQIKVYPPLTYNAALQPASPFVGISGISTRLSSAIRRSSMLSRKKLLPDFDWVTIQATQATNAIGIYSTGLLERHLSNN